MNIQPTKALDEFLRVIQLEKNFSVHTVKEYERDITQFLTFLRAEGVDDLREVEYIHARLFVTKLYEEKLSRTTVSRKISSIRTFFRFLNRDYGIDLSPFLSLYHPKKEKLLPNFFMKMNLHSYLKQMQATI